MSDFVFDESKSFKPKEVNENSVVFLNTDLLDIFFTYYHPHIKNKYILITHNSDRSISEDDLIYLDGNVKHWFATKLNTKATDKVSPLSYGLENRRYLKKWENNLFQKNTKKISKFNKKRKGALFI